MRERVQPRNRVIVGCGCYVLQHNHLPVVNLLDSLMLILFHAIATSCKSDRASLVVVPFGLRLETPTSQARARKHDRTHETPEVDAAATACTQASYVATAENGRTEREREVDRGTGGRGRGALAYSAPYLLYLSDPTPKCRFKCIFNVPSTQRLTSRDLGRFVTPWESGEEICHSLSLGYHAMHRTR